MLVGIDSYNHSLVWIHCRSHLPIECFIGVEKIGGN